MSNNFHKLILVLSFILNFSFSQAQLSLFEIRSNETIDFSYQQLRTYAGAEILNPTDPDTQYYSLRRSNSFGDQNTFGESSMSVYEMGISGTESNFLGKKWTAPVEPSNRNKISRYLKFNTASHTNHNLNLYSDDYREILWSTYLLNSNVVGRRQAIKDLGVNIAVAGATVATLARQGFIPANLAIGAVAGETVAFIGGAVLGTGLIVSIAYNMFIDPYQYYYSLYMSPSGHLVVDLKNDTDFSPPYIETAWTNDPNHDGRYLSQDMSLSEYLQSNHDKNHKDVDTEFSDVIFSTDDNFNRFGAVSQNERFLHLSGTVFETDDFSAYHVGNEQGERILAVNHIGYHPAEGGHIKFKEDGHIAITNLDGDELFQQNNGKCALDYRISAQSSFVRKLMLKDDGNISHFTNDREVWVKKDGNAYGYCVFPTEGDSELSEKQLIDVSGSQIISDTNLQVPFLRSSDGSKLTVLDGDRIKIYENDNGLYSPENPISTYSL